MRCDSCRHGNVMFGGIQSIARFTWGWCGGRCFPCSRRRHYTLGGSDGVPSHCLWIDCGGWVDQSAR